jgi:2-hydroxylaminobenzoate mutase
MSPTGKHKPELLALARRVLQEIGDRPFNAELEFRLNRLFGPASVTYDALERLLHLGLSEGWVGYEAIEGAEYRRGRIAEPSAETAGMSIESALLRDVKGRYHCHTRGEIDLVIPIDSGARFCGHGAGWVVYPPMSEHFPTVTGGKALFMFFLPNGEIEYKAPPSV